MDYVNQIVTDATLLREISTAPTVQTGTSSANLFEILKKYISAFEKSLDSDHEVGMLLTNLGRSTLLQVTYVSYEAPSIMIFKGYVDNSYATLIQHVSQLNFLLLSVPKTPDRPKQRIGFSIEE